MTTGPKWKVETHEFGLEDSLTWLIFSCQSSDTKVYFLKMCRLCVRSLQLYDEMPIVQWCCDSGCTHRWLCFSEISLFASVTPWRESWLLSSYATFGQRQNISQAAERKHHRCQLHEESMSICWRPDLNSGGASTAVCTSQSPGQIREETDGHLGLGRAYILAQNQFCILIQRIQPLSGRRLAYSSETRTQMFISARILAVYREQIVSRQHWHLR